MQRLRFVSWLAALTLVTAVGAGEPRTIVVWAPGYPGDSEQARDAMADFSAAVGRAAGWPDGSVVAVYHNDVDEGRGAVESTADLALVPMPVLFHYGDALGLAPVMRVVPAEGAEQVWSLVARKGRVSSPGALAGWELAGRPGYAPGFVRGPVLGAWGELPEATRIVFTSRVLAALRRAAAGEDVAVLVDRAQAEALGSLPFAADLEVVTRSPALPASFVCRVGDRLSEGDLARLRDALAGLHGTESGVELLSSLRLARFEPLDPARAAGATLPASAGR